MGYSKKQWTIYVSMKLFLQLTNSIVLDTSMVSCQKGPIRHASAWQIGPSSQDTLVMGCSSNTVAKCIHHIPKEIAYNSRFVAYYYSLVPVDFIHILYDYSSGTAPVQRFSPNHLVKIMNLHRIQNWQKEKSTWRTFCKNHQFPANSTFDLKWIIIWSELLSQFMEIFCNKDQAACGLNVYQTKIAISRISAFDIFDFKRWIYMVIYIARHSLTP